MSQKQPNPPPPSARRPTNSIAKLEALGARGLVISICYGATPQGLGYSVDCLHDASKQSFARPFAARDFAHCLEIVETEAIRRGWLSSALEASGNVLPKEFEAAVMSDATITGEVKYQLPLRPGMVDGVQHDLSCECLHTPAFQPIRRPCSCGAVGKSKR